MALPQRGRDLRKPACRLQRHPECHPGFRRAHPGYDPGNMQGRVSNPPLCNGVLRALQQSQSPQPQAERISWASARASSCSRSRIWSRSSRSSTFFMSSNASAERAFRVFQLELEIVSRALEVLAPPHGRLGVSGIGEMVGVVNAGAVLLGFDLTLEVACDALELCDHHLDLCRPSGASRRPETSSGG